MNGYVCNKPCKFGGVAYSVGDTIPFESVLPCREKALIKQGFISPAIYNSSVETLNVTELQTRVTELEMLLEDSNKRASGSGSIQPIVIPITSKSGLLELVMEPVDIVMAISTLQLNAEEAVQTIDSINKEEILILIDTLDSRKTVKSAVSERAEIINTEGKVGKEDESQVDA